MATTSRVVGYDELATLKLLALDGALEGREKASCADIADRLDASNQTASRRLQRLEEADLIERDIVSDGQQIAITEVGEAALQREYADYQRIFDRGAGVDLGGIVTSGMGGGATTSPSRGTWSSLSRSSATNPSPARSTWIWSTRARESALA